ncbi:MAG: hypothetical protein ACFN4S_00050 [Prevotella conceptionensis]
MSSTFDLITGKKPTPTQQGNQWQQIAAQQQFTPPVAQQQTPPQAVPQQNTPLKDPMVMKPAAQAQQVPTQQPPQPTQQVQPQPQQPQQQAQQSAQAAAQVQPADGTQYVSPTAHMNLREKVKYFTGEDLNAPDNEDNPYRSKQVKTYEDMTQRLEDEERRLRPETEESRKKRERKEKREKLFAALGDGLSALSNVYFTTQGAPDMSSKKTLTAAVQEKYDKMKAEREADRDKYLNILKLKADNFGRLGDMDDAKHARRMALIKSAYDYEAKQDENARKNRESNSKIKLDTAKGKKLDADAAYSTARAKEEPKNAASKRALDAARAKQANAGAANSLAHAAKARVETAAARKKADRENGKFTLNLGEKGVLKFSNEKEFNKTVQRWAKAMGIPTSSVEGEERSYNGKVTKTGHTKYKPIDVLAGAIEDAAETYNWSDYDNKKKQAKKYSGLSIRKKQS